MNEWTDGSDLADFFSTSFFALYTMIAKRIMALKDVLAVVDIGRVPVQSLDDSGSAMRTPYS